MTIHTAFIPGATAGAGGWPARDRALVPGIALRSIRSDDAGELQAFHRRLSDDAVFNRFLGFHRQLSDKEARRFTAPVAGEETALVATADGRIVAVGRSIRSGPGEAAEVAFVVADAHQHHGLGRTLLTLLARFAWDDGVRRFVADTFVTNRSMLDVFLHSPRAVTVLSTRRDREVLHLVMQISRPGGELVPLGGLRTPS